MLTLLYFAMTFAATWTLWWYSGVFTGIGSVGPSFLLGVFAPGVLALVFTAAHGRGPGSIRLLRRLVDVNVAPRCYAVALTYTAAIKLAVAVVHRVAFDAWPAFGREPWYVLFAAALLSTIVGGQAGEELGWRGYALPRLANRLGLGPASVLLGVVWSLWHLPLFFAPGADTFHQSFLMYVLQITALSVALAWVYERANGSLVPVMLMHAAANNVKDLVPSGEPTPLGVWSIGHSPVGWLTVLMMWIVAVYFLMTMRTAVSSRRRPAHATIGSA